MHRDFPVRCEGNEGYCWGLERAKSGGSVWGPKTTGSGAGSGGRRKRAITEGELPSFTRLGSPSLWRSRWRASVLTTGKQVRALSLSLSLSLSLLSAFLPTQPIRQSF